MRSAVAMRRRRVETIFRRFLVVGGLIFGTLWLLTLLAERSSSHPVSWQVITFFWLALGSVIFLWSCIPESKKAREQFQVFRDAVAGCHAVVLRIASEQMVEFEEWEDEGACYAFQLAEQKIIFVSGQDFYYSAKFPNSDFSLVHVVTAKGFLVEEFIVKGGHKLAPVRTISAEDKAELLVPGHLEIIDGRLDELESLLASETDELISGEPC